jgi:Flp pilus assembly protein CpaB
MVRLRLPRSPAHTARRAAAALLAVCALVLALRPAAGPVADEAPRGLPVVVTASDLPAGTALSGDDLAIARLPAEFVPAGTSPEPGALVGRVLAGSVRAGEPLTDIRLVGAGLTRLLGEDQVAAPVRLADLAVAALVRTGDRVDVLATPPDAGRADLVAANALVLAAGAPVPGRAAEPATDPATGLLLVAVDRATAAHLAAAAAASTLTVTLPPP